MISISKVEFRYCVVIIILVTKENFKLKGTKAVVIDQLSMSL